MPIIGIVQLKGGAGRSTVATNLAAALAKNDTVTLIDADMPQGTASAWYAIRQEDRPQESLACISVDNHRDLITVAEKESKASEWVIIDSPPRIAGITKSILLIADLCIVPASATLADVWATDDIYTLIQEAEKNGTVQPRILWNRYRSFTRSANEIRQGTKAEINLPHFKTQLGFRVSYADALGAGASVMEWSDPKAKAEMAAVVAEVKKLTK